MKAYRQGEIIIIKMDKSESDIIFTDNASRLAPVNNNVIREGELTGHNHAVVDGELVDLNGTMYLRAGDNTSVTHPEHKELKLDKGDYKIVIQREYDEEADRLVRD